MRLSSSSLKIKKGTYLWFLLWYRLGLLVASAVDLAVLVHLAIGLVLVASLLWLLRPLVLLAWPTLDQFLLVDLAFARRLHLVGSCRLVLRRLLLVLLDLVVWLDVGVLRRRPLLLLLPLQLLLLLLFLRLLLQQLLLALLLHQLLLLLDLLDDLAPSS